MRSFQELSLSFSVPYSTQLTDSHNLVDFPYFSNADLFFLCFEAEKVHYTSIFTHSENICKNHCKISAVKFIFTTKAGF